MKLYAIAAGLNGAVSQSLYGHHYLCHINESYPGQEKNIHVTTGLWKNTDIRLAALVTAVGVKTV